MLNGRKALLANRRRFVREAAAAAFLLLSSAGLAHATNFQVPPGHSGVLVLANSTGGDLGLVPGEFGLIQRNASGEATYVKLTLNYNDTFSTPFYRAPVSGGEVFEFYLRRNAAGVDPNLPPQTFSSDPTRNTALDPNQPEHFFVTNTGGDNWFVAFGEINQTTDPPGAWDHYGDQFKYFKFWIEPGCGGEGPACPDPNIISSNHGPAIPSVGRDIIKAVGNVVGQLGPSIAGTSNVSAKSQYTCVNARIDNATWNFVQESIDFSTRRPDMGATCAPDDGSDFSGPHNLKQLQIKRFHRPKYDYLAHSSFGIGVFSEFDMDLTIFPGAGGQESNVVMFDPRSDAPPINFYETSTDAGDSSVDGVYNDRATRAYRSLIFYNPSGQQEPNPRLADNVRVTKHNGESFLFEIIDVQGGSPSAYLSGRLREYRDRNGNLFRINYVNGAHAGDGIPWFDRTSLWLIDNVVDMTGVSAIFSYFQNGTTLRWMLGSVEWNDGVTTRNLSYNYSESPAPDPDRLIEVVYPDGARSHFSRTWDSASQTYKLDFDDVAGEGNGINHVFAYVTGPFYVSGGVTYNQVPGLVRRVVNADNERVYQNWEDPHDASTTYFALGTGAAGSTLTRIKTNLAGAILEVARAQTFVADPLQAVYTVDESYTPGSQGLFGSILNAVGQVTSMVRDAVGNVTGVTTPDNKTSSTTLDANGRVTHQVDALGVITDMTYDAAGNLLTTTTAVGTPRQQLWRYAYNSKGLMTSVTTPAGIVTDYAYDTAGRLLSVADPADVAGGTRPTRTFEYDVLSRRKAELDQASRRTTYTFDIRGRLVTTTYPDSTTDRTLYSTGSEAGVIDAQFDRNGITRGQRYDATRRTTLRFQSGNQPNASLNETVTYFPGRYLASATNDNGTRTEVTYDYKDMVIQQKNYATNTTFLTGQMTYDAAGRMTTETDGHNRKTYYVYDAVGRKTRKVWELVPGGVPAGSDIATLARITTANPAYVIQDQGYDAVGRVTSQTNERGHITTTTYDELGRRTQTVEASGTPRARTTTYQYDSSNKLTAEVGPRSTTAYTYTRRGLLASMTAASGTSEAVTARRTYTLTGSIATMTDPRNGVTTNTYATTADYLVSRRDPGGFTTSVTYDPMGHVLTRTDPNGLVTTLRYDGRYRKLQETDGLNHSTFFDYDDDLSDSGGLSGQPIYSVPLAPIGFGPNAKGHGARIGNAAGEPRFVATDGLGRKVLEVDAIGNAVRTTHDTITNGLSEVRSTSALGQVTILRQDGRGNTREAVDADGKLTTNKFDAAGNMVSSRDPNNIGVDCVYNELQQRTSCTNTHGDVTSWVYDLDGNVTSNTDARGKTRTCLYDRRNRQTSCTDALGNTQSFTYDANSNLLTERDGQARTTTYTYDSRNLQTSITYPDSTGSTDKVTVTYDAGRRVQSTKDQSGNTISTTYDAANRLTQTTYPDGLNDTYGYDAADRLTSANSARYGVATARTYDAAGRAITEKTTQGGHDYQVGYAYDGASRLTTLTYPDLSQVSRTYGLGRDLITQLKLGTFTVATYAYDNAGRVTTATLGNGLVETRSYRANDNTISQFSTPQVGTLTFTYDQNKNRLTEGGTAASGNQTFVYDNENRVTSWTGPSLTQTWSLSAEGDWNSTTRNMVVENRTHNNAHELTAVGATSLTYDARGNMTHDNSNNNLVWDFTNRLKQFQKSGGPTVDFLYDALGRQVGRKVGTTTDIHVFAGDHVIADYRNAALVKNYILGAGADDYVAYVNGGSLFWYSKDAVNSVKAITNEGGAVSERYRYTAYGERTILTPSGTVRTATAVNNFIGFTGRPHDVDTGLIDFRSRQYQPRLGRFISRDSIGYVSGHNLYRGYFAPNKTDPGGHFPSLSDIGNAIVSAPGKVVDAGKAAVGAVVDLGTSAVNAVDAGINGVAGLAGDIGNAFINGVEALGTELWAGTTYLLAEAWDGIETLGSWIETGASYTWRGLKHGAKAWWYDMVVDGAKLVASAAVVLGKTLGQAGWDIIMMYYDLFTGHPLDAFKRFTNYCAGCVNICIAAISFEMTLSSAIIGCVSPIGGPTSWVGIAIGLIGALVTWEAPSATWAPGGFIFEFKNSPLAYGAGGRTLGRAIYYTGTPTAATVAHERQHVRQYEMLGELYLPAHAIAQAWSWSTTGTYDEGNWLETGPNHVPPDPGDANISPKIPRWN